MWVLAGHSGGRSGHSWWSMAGQGNTDWGHWPEYHFARQCHCGCCQRHCNLWHSRHLTYWHLWHSVPSHSTWQVQHHCHPVTDWSCKERDDSRDDTIDSNVCHTIQSQCHCERCHWWEDCHKPWLAGQLTNLCHYKHSKLSMMYRQNVRQF